MLQMGQDAEAVEAFRLALDNNPNHTRGKALLAAAAALSGHFECAKQMMAEYAKADPGMTVRKFAEQRSSVPLDLVSPTYRRENERILEGLRRAGMSAG